MNLSILVILSLLLNNFLFSQNLITIKGIVKDKNSKEILAFANISILQKHIGTVSNEKGKFNFKIPKKYIDDTLIISFIGYHNLKLHIKDLKLTNNFKSFFIEKSILILEEVNVISKKIKAEDIFFKAIEKIPENYYTKKHISDVYFEEKEFQNGKYKKSHMKLGVAIKLYTPKFKKTHKYIFSALDETVEIIGVRRNEDCYTEPIKIIKKINEVKITLKRNIFRYKHPFLRKKFLKKYNFEKENTKLYDDNLVYIINLKYENRSVKFFIRKDNFAIMEVQFFYDSKKPSEINKIIKREIYDIEKYVEIIKFKEINNKLFLYTMYSYHDIKNFEQNGEMLLNSQYFTKILVNNIDTVNVRKPENKMKNKSIYYQENLEYDPEFWENYNHILDTISK